MRINSEPSLDIGIMEAVEETVQLQQAQMWLTIMQQMSDQGNDGNSERSMKDRGGVQNSVLDDAGFMPSWMKKQDSDRLSDSMGDLLKVMLIQFMMDTVTQAVDELKEGLELLRDNFGSGSKLFDADKLKDMLREIGFEPTVDLNQQRSGITLDGPPMAKFNTDVMKSIFEAVRSDLRDNEPISVMDNLKDLSLFAMNEVRKDEPSFATGSVFDDLRDAVQNQFDFMKASTAIQKLFDDPFSADNALSDRLADAVSRFDSDRGQSALNVVKDDLLNQMDDMRAAVSGGPAMAVVDAVRNAVVEQFNNANNALGNGLEGPVNAVVKPYEAADVFAERPPLFGMGGLESPFADLFKDMALKRMDDIREMIAEERAEALLNNVRDAILETFDDLRASAGGRDQSGINGGLEKLLEVLENLKEAIMPKDSEPKLDKMSEMLVKLFDQNADDRPKTGPWVDKVIELIQAPFDHALGVGAATQDAVPVSGANMEAAKGPVGTAAIETPEVSNPTPNPVKSPPNTDTAISAGIDLSNWKLTLPSDGDGNGKADEISTADLAKATDLKNMRHNDDGSITFSTQTDDPAMTSNTKYRRSELREMIRGDDTSIGTKDAGNNWTTSAASESDRAAAGAVDGTMKATVSIDKVTEQGDPDQAGRVIIGQIHAENDEPCRLYYHKAPGSETGSIYFAHEPQNGEEETWHVLVGNKEGTSPDGIKLGEEFDYEIDVKGNDLNVSITTANGETYQQNVDMEEGGYADPGTQMYFKAGAYDQNNTTPDPATDYSEVTMKKLDVVH